MDPVYVEKLKEWVECDNQILHTKNLSGLYIEKKKILEEEILDYIETNKYDKLTINTPDGFIKFSKRNVPQPLSIKTLKPILDKYIQDNNISIDVSDLLKFISDNIEMKQKYFMKREIKD